MPVELVIMDQDVICAGCGKVITAGEEAREYPGEKYYHKVEPKEKRQPAPAAPRPTAAVAAAAPLTPAESQQLLTLAGRYLRWIIKG